jgi:hypothetical protein
MRSKNEPRKTDTALRFTAALLVFAHLAVVACLATHHHARPNDKTPCLVCACAAAPAADLDHAPAPAPPAESAGAVPSLDESADPFFLPGSAGIRAPPIS